MVAWVIYVSIGILIGFAAGFYISRLDDPHKKKREELENKLELATEEMINYKQDVTEHFVKTSNLVNDMTDSYRAVYNHMAEGAKNLCPKPLIESLATQNQLDIPKTRLIETQDDAVDEKIDETVKSTDETHDTLAAESVVADSVTEETAATIEASDDTETSPYETGTIETAADTIVSGSKADDTIVDETVLHEPAKKQDTPVVH